MLPIFVVNLDRDVARRARIAALLEAHGLEARFRKAVDGAALDQARLAEVYDSARNSEVFKRPLSRPEIGCYLSHLALWSEIADGEAPGAIVFEDDIVAAPGLKAVLQSLSRIELGESVVKLYAPNMGLRRVRAQLPFAHKLVAPWVAPACTTGYVISRAAARKMADQALPFARPVDLDIKHWWEFGITVLAVSPSLVVPADHDDSSIETGRRMTRRQFNLLQRFLRNLKYQARFHTRLLGASVRRWTTQATEPAARDEADPLTLVQLP